MRRPEHFGLTGKSVALDPRVNAYRADIADIALAGTLVAPHYAAPLPRRVTEPAVIRAAADDAAEPCAQLAHGEAFDVLDIADGWAWGYAVDGHLVGYVPLTVLEP